MPGKRIDFVGCSLVLIALSATSDVLARRHDRDPGQRCRVQAPDVLRSKKPRAHETPSFSASEILDLELMVRLPRSIRTGRVEVKFFTPEGHLYQTMSVPVSTEGKSRRRSVIVTLPVAGTMIVRDSLYGTWTVEAHVNGSPTPCGSALEVAIHP